MTDLVSGNTVKIVSPNYATPTNARAVYRTGQIGTITEIVFTKYSASSEGFAKIKFADGDDNIELEYCDKVEGQHDQT